MRYFLLLLVALTASASAYTKDGTTYTTSGEQADVVAAITDATPGDTVNVPAGTFEWGAGGSKVDVLKNITLQGAGQGVTIINQSATALSGFEGGTLWVSGPCLIRGMTMNQASSKVLIHCTWPSGDGWRFTDLSLNFLTSSRAWYVNQSYGLVDHCDIQWNAEVIFTTGKAGEWNTENADVAGNENAVIFEDNVFRGPFVLGQQGYTDGNVNAKMVYRYNTITGAAKFDSHGATSNAGGISSRLIEAYYNTWTAADPISSSIVAVEHRGGLGYMFFNHGTNTSNVQFGMLKMQEYYVASGGYLGRFPGPDDYPIPQQVGRGKSNTPQPSYIFGNTRKQRYGVVGAAVMPVVAVQNNVPATAITQYRARIGDPAATFTHEDIVKFNRDYFSDTMWQNGVGLSTTHWTFDGTDNPTNRAGVGIGTKAQMLAITPTLLRAGFWVTDEGDWNTVQDGPDGQLYQWNGTSWVKIYTPLEYPHPRIAETEGAVVRPTHSPESGTYDEPFEVTIATTTPGATIYYTLDGSTPDNTDATYSTPLAITETTTLKSIAYVGAEASTVRTSVYTFEGEEPPPSGVNRLRIGGKAITVGGKAITIGDN